MPHKSWKLLLFCWSIVTLSTLAADVNAQETLQPYPPSILHTFLDSRNVYPESVTVDQSSGTFFVGSVKEGTIRSGPMSLNFRDLKWRTGSEFYYLNQAPSWFCNKLGRVGSPDFLNSEPD